MQANAVGTGQTFTEATGLVIPLRYTYTGVTFNNMVLVTTTQAADATVTKNRVLLEYAPSTLVLNTDLTVEVTCDGSTWVLGTLSAAGTAQAGRRVAEIADTTCSVAGQQFAARIKTLTNKDTQIFKSTVTVN